MKVRPQLEILQKTVGDGVHGQVVPSARQLRSKIHVNFRKVRFASVVPELQENNRRGCGNRGDKIQSADSE